MCRLKTCCFCFTLKTGVCLAAGYTILLGTLSVLLCVWSVTVRMSAANDILQTELDKQLLDQYTDGDYDQAVEYGVSLLTIVYYVVLGIFATWLISGILLIVGVKTKSRGWFIPWIVMTCILIVFDLLGLAGLIRNCLIANDRDRGYYEMAVTGVNLLGNIIAVMAVNSYYKNNCREHEEVMSSTVHMEGVVYKKCGTDQPQV